MLCLSGILFYKNSPEIYCFINTCRDNNEKFHYKRVVESKIYDFFLYLKIVHKSFTPDNARDYLSQEGINFDSENQKIIEESLKKLSSVELINEDLNNKIPLISHRTYFTSQENPKEINNLYIEILKSSYEKLNTVGKWTHYIWTNNIESIPTDIKTISGVKILHIDILKDHVLYVILQEVLKKGNDLTGYFSAASDTLRFMVLERYGGMYNDMDYEIYNVNLLIKLIRNFDFIGVAGLNDYYESGFIISTANHPILKRAVQLQLRNYGFNNDEYTPIAIKYPSDPYRKIFFSGPPLITVAYMQENNKFNNNDIILPHWVGFNSMFAHFKNGMCGNTEISSEEFRSKNKNLVSLLRIFTEEYKKDPNSLYNRFKPLNENQHNIYYDPEHFDDMEIIGGDMVCGSWSKQFEGFNRFYYWKFPWQK